MTDYKVGDRVRIVNSSSVVQEYRGKSGVITALVCKAGHGFSIKLDGFELSSSHDNDGSVCFGYTNNFELITSNNPVTNSNITLLTTAAPKQDDRKKIWARCDSCDVLRYIERYNEFWYCSSCKSAAENGKVTK